MNLTGWEPRQTNCSRSLSFPPLPLREGQGQGQGQGEGFMIHRVCTPVLKSIDTWRMP